MIHLSQRIYVCKADRASELKSLLEYDPYLDKSLTEEQLHALKEKEESVVIFARQDYLLKDGISLGMDRESSYLYLNATDDFLDKAEKVLKEKIDGITRAPEDLERQIITRIETERKESEQGLGLIFG